MFTGMTTCIQKNKEAITRWIAVLDFLEFINIFFARSYVAFLLVRMRNVPGEDLPCIWFVVFWQHSAMIGHSGLVE